MRICTYMIGYDIHPTQGETYDELNEALKAYPYWWHHLDSTWFIVTDQTAREILHNLKQHMKADDQLVVMKTCGIGAWSGCSEHGGKWLKDNI